MPAQKEAIKAAGTVVICRKEREGRDAPAQRETIKAAGTVIICTKNAKGAMRLRKGIRSLETEK